MAEQMTEKIYPDFLKHREKLDNALLRDFSAVYEAHRLSVYRYVLARVGHVDDAHDITAQVFLKAYQKATHYRDDAPVIHWLIVIARNQIIDHHRQARSELPLELAGHLPNGAPPLEETVDYRLKMQRVSEALHSLSEERREALALRLFAGLKNQEIAELMGKSADAVAMLVYRGVQDLNARLGKEINE